MADYSSSVSCSEELGSVREDFDIGSGNGPSMSVDLRCLWSDRFSLVQDIVGNQRAWPHGTWTTVAPRAYAASIKQDTSVFATTGQSNEVVHAIVSVRYGCKVLQLVSESLEPTVEFLTLDHNQFRWANAAADGPGDPVLEAEAPGKLFRGLNLVRTYYQLNSVPTAILTLPGAVNAAQYVSALLGLTFPAETLLFQPPKLDRVIKTTGATGFNMTLKFQYKPQGWNTFWRAKTREWSKMWILADAGADPPVAEAEYDNYPPDDFSGLLS